MLFNKFFCRNCNFKSYSIIKMTMHLKKAHNSKLTKKDWIFALKHNVIAQVLKAIFTLPIILGLLAVWCICYPFWLIKEFIDNLF